ncbi:hypothetical protein VTP01DRAFT_7347 [Rhizomucor pusillus]|uniref:uncharacterized protein n=1 Tax=Rhizomucor pusillus TaxID=4840 RepID=UPI00374245C4
MPTCVECGASVQDLYTQYSKDNIRLTSCHKCNEFADKYIEHDFVIIFIDMLLHKPQVYRHLLFNRIPQYTDGIEPQVLRFAILLILFEVYIKWFRLETYYTNYDTEFFQQPVYYQYPYILSLCILEFSVFHASIWLIVLSSGIVITKSWLVLLMVPLSSYNYVSMALIVSSFGKMLLILMAIWDYKQVEYSWLVSFIVLASNTEALSVYLDIPYTHSLMIMFLGTIGKLAAKAAFLNATFKDGQQSGSSSYINWFSL